MQQNAIALKNERKKAEASLKEQVKATVPCWIQLASLYASVSYFLYFNFENSYVRLAFLCFLILFPTASLLFNFYVSALFETKEEE